VSSSIAVDASTPVVSLTNDITQEAMQPPFRDMSAVHYRHKFAPQP
jgi:hypothetical protein